MFDVAFVLFAFIALILLIMASPLQIKARNTGVLLNMAWLWISTFFYLVNAIIWRNHSENVAPVWCDISESASLDYHSNPRRQSPDWHVDRHHGL
jgi:uncharacterized membrane protein